MRRVTISPRCFFVLVVEHVQHFHQLCPATMLLPCVDDICVTCFHESENDLTGV
jgi:hypothetical protein